MNPKVQFCPNINCPARNRIEKGRIVIHSQKKRRYKCQVCGKTFSESNGTPFYRLKTDIATVVLVITLLAYGCPIQAIVMAFGFDERTVTDWLSRAGSHCEQLHEHLVQKAQLNLEHVQVDEIKVKARGRSIWLGMAIMVRTRLWLGGDVSPKRNKKLLTRVFSRIRQIALCRPLLLSVDGLPGYIDVIGKLFRSKIPRGRGQRGRCRLYAWPQICIEQVVKYRHPQFFVDRRLIQGCQQLVAHLRTVTQGKLGVANTAYIERLNATFRSRFTWLVRRSRALAHQPELLQKAMFLVGTLYNFCDTHQSLRLPLAVGSRRTRWVSRTPAIAAGLADHIWTVDELLKFKVPLASWQPPKRRGRPTKAMQALVQEWC